MNKYLMQFLELAIVADAEYANAKTNGTATLLQPANFQNAILAVSQILAATPATTPAPSV